jgi:molybdopterin synthase catalytic subunit
MPGFVQVIEWRTSRIDEVQKLNEEWRERFPEMGPTRVLVGRSREDTGNYLTLVEFESYEAAMKNSQDPATSEFAERMGKLCDGPPTFRDLDVIQEENRT